MIETKWGPREGWFPRDPLRENRPAPATLSQRNLALVIRQPLIKRLQLRIQRTRYLQAARSDKFRLEVVIELEHVAQVFRSRESESAIRIRSYRVVFAGNTQALRILL